ncbi:ABC transporter permease [Rhodococcus sp. OK302]|uniref:ABC transporter permease n=1 Tax=Rhodococcus sp. OK302 TaxID=1882769 RepID=UPI000B945CF1|nr:ABC transporter permease [Rhodococcus sp. OK302]OYD61126.1 peptide/nickel transport system permease protein [Rhodococcus sp. OK302]
MSTRSWSRPTLRVLRVLAILWVVSLLCFFSMNLLPGDPAQAILGVTATPEGLASLRQQMGLNEPVVERYLAWIGGVLTGDLGQSFHTQQEVGAIVLERTPVTIELIVLSQAIALAFAVPAAIAAAVRRRSGADKAISLWVFTVLSTPNFVIGVLLVWVFAIVLGWFPSNGFVPVSDGLIPHLSSVLLPSIALAAAPFALYQRVLRADLASTFDREFIAVARAKGIAPHRVVFGHALRPSLLGLSTSVGVTVGTMIGSTVVIETLFGLPGIGSELVRAVQTRDFVTVQGIVLAIATAFIVINTTVDYLYGIIDPRLRSAKLIKGDVHA